jgi:phenylpropionate dioxygenase-like ring-hydroxylating dioxygenase large terminal subunit
VKRSNDVTDLARRALDHLREGTTDQAEDTMALPVDAYLDPGRFAYEFDAIFLRRPQALLLTVEIPEPGDYVARTIMTKPLLFVRGKDGVARVFLNVCRHRGAKLCPDGKGRAPRFVCPYHAWSYDRQGKLVGMYGKDKFGDADPATLGLTELTSIERAGVIWAVLTPGLSFDITEWLGDFAAELEKLELADWHLFDQRTLPGPGWKVTMDGYLEAYHHDNVHANTLSKHTIGNLLVHDLFGRHQLLTMARRNLPELETLPPSEWDAGDYIRQIHCTFPNFQLSGIRGGHCLVSQIFPGLTPSESVTIQTILSAEKPTTPRQQADSEAFSAMALEAVGSEDYPIGFGIQAGLASGANGAFLIGRNEPGLQHYHRTVAREVAAAMPPERDTEGDRECP